MSRAAKVFLQNARQKFEAGDYTVILRCMNLCMELGIKPPDWLRNAFCDRVRAPENFETWDDAFGPPMPPGTKRARREELKNWIPLVFKIRELRARDIKGQDLYEQAADELGLRRGWESVRDAYYRQPKNLRVRLEYYADVIEAEVREKIRTPDGQLLVSFEEWRAWFESYIQRVPFPWSS